MNDVLLAYGGFAPTELNENRAFHQSLLDDMTVEARKRGWSGTAFALYGRSEGYVSIQIEPADGGELTLEGLAAFREEQRHKRDVAPEQPALL